MIIHKQNLFLLVSLALWGCQLVFGAGNAVSLGNREAEIAPQHLNLTLEEAIRIALKSNRSLVDQNMTLSDKHVSLAASEDVFNIKIRPLSSINYSTGSDSDVKVWEVGGAISRRFQTGVDLVLRPSIAKGNDEYDASIGFSIAVPLLRGLGEDVVKDNVYINEFSVATSLRNIHRQRVNVMLETISGVYSYTREQQLINLYKEQIDRLKRHLRHVRIKEKIGLARSMDVYRVEIRIKEVEDSLNLTQESAENIIDQLKTTLALPLGYSLSVQAPLEYSLISLELNKAVDIALTKRIEIKQGKADISEAERREKVARLNIRPELNLEATYVRRGRFSEVEQLSDFDEDVFRVGLMSNTDFERSSEKAIWAQSKITVSRGRLQYEIIKDTITRELRTVLNLLEKSEKRIELRREQIEQAKGKQRLAQVKFQHGEADNFDLIESQAQYQRAQVNLVSDEIQYIIGGYRLRAAMGTLLEYNGI